MSILEHGESVHSYYLDLHNFLFNDETLKFEWRFPEWLTTHKEYIKANLLPMDIMRDYHIFHDCGKPSCVTIDSDGRRHFSNHASVSKQRWLECTEQTIRNTQIGELISMDMDIHLLNAESLSEFSTRPQAISLLLTGMCEIHSNAAMFGGIESTSFKIKFKHIDKRGRQLINMIKK